MSKVTRTSGKTAFAAAAICAAAVCAAKPAAERMDRSKLLIGAYCLQENAKTGAHIKAIHDCGVDFIIGGLPASDRATLDLFAKKRKGVQECCQCENIAVTAPCGDSQPIGTRTRRANRGPSGQFQFPIEEAA